MIQAKEFTRMVKDNLGFTFAAARQTLTSVAGLELLASLIRRLDLIRSIRSEVRVKKIDYGFREEEHLIPLLLNIALDRKSTRLNSSHLGISYAVFCLK